MLLFSTSQLAVFAGSLGLASVASARKCTNLVVDVTTDARNAVFNLTAPKSNIEVTDFVLDLTQQGHNATKEFLTGVSYSISGSSTDSVH